MAQEARSISVTNQASELHVLGSSPAQGGSFPEDFVAAVERRAALSQDNPIDYEDDEPWHTRVPKTVAIASAAFAAGILVVAGIMFTGDGSPQQAGDAAVAANVTDQNVAEPAAMASQPTANTTDDVATAVGQGAVGLPALVAPGDLAMVQPPVLDELSTTSGELGYFAVAMPLSGDPAVDVAEASAAPLDDTAASMTSDAIVPPVPEEEPASVFAAVDMTSPSSASDVQLASLSSDSDAVVTASQATPVDGVRVQLASYGSEQRAQKGWASLQAEHADMFANLDPMIEKADLETGTFYRLRVGSFASISEAGQFCGTLSDRQVSCIVVPR